MVQIAGFVVGPEIGRGSFGVVHRARELATGQDVAIKVLHDVPGTDLRQRFLAECRAVGALGGAPGIPAVHSTGLAADGSPYLALQLLPNGSLADRQPLPADRAVAVARRLTEALGAAHAAGVVHRDVKPANVLFDADDQPVLVDFGIAALVDEAAGLDAGPSDTVAVSVAFAPPEALAGGRPDPLADVYALGATLFCALAGRAPFVSTYGREPIEAVAARVATARVEDLRPLGVPDALAAVVETAMAKDPAQRYPTMAAFGAALDRVSAGLADTVAAGGVGRRRRLRRAPVLAAAAAAVLLGGGLTAVALSTGGSGSPGREPQAGPVAASASHGVLAGRRSGDPTGGSAADPQQVAGGPRAGRTAVADGVLGGVSVGADPTTGTHTSTTVLPGTHAAPPPAPPTATTAAPPSSARTTSAAPPPPVNHPPTIVAAARTGNEGVALSVPITVSDPDGNPVTLTVAGLPSWLRLAGGTVSGTPPYNAASVTTTHTAIKAKTFTLTVTATDSHGATTTTSVGVTVRDTLRLMPDYIGKSGNGSPTIAAVSTPVKGCAYEKGGTGKLIYWQGVRPGAVIAWGKKITYRYGSSSTSCTHVTGHWPS